MWKPSTKKDNSLIVLLALILVVFLLIGLSYLITTGLVAVVLWAFSIEYNAWLAGLGVWVILILLKGFRR